MVGLPYFNFAAFDAAAALGRSLGWTVVSPAELYRVNGFDETQFPDGVTDFTPDAYRDLINRDVAVLTGTLKAEEADCIAALPGWDASLLALSCMAVALRAGLGMLDATTFNPLREANVFKAVVNRVNS